MVDRRSLSGPGLRPDPFRLSWCCRDNHEEAKRWTIQRARTSPRLRADLSISFRSLCKDKRSTERTLTAYSASWHTPFVIPATSMRWNSLGLGAIVSWTMARIAFRFLKTDRGYRCAARALNFEGALLADDLADRRLLRWRKHRGHAANASHARANGQSVRVQLATWGASARRSHAEQTTTRPSGKTTSSAVMSKPRSWPFSRTVGCFAAGMRPAVFQLWTVDGGSLR